MKKIFYAFAACSFIACGSPQSSGTGSDTTAADTTSVVSEKEKEPSVKWEYSEKEDKMTSEKKYFASIVSSNELQFQFPYDGGSSGQILVRNSEGKNEILFSISKGQFVTDIVDGTTVKVRFDEEKPITFSAGSSSDGSSDLLFLSPAKKFITNLKAAKKVIVQAEFYESGLQELEFDVAGFKWEH